MKQKTDYTYIIDNTLGGNNKVIIELTYLKSTDSSSNTLTLTFTNPTTAPSIIFVNSDKTKSVVLKTTIICKENEVYVTSLN